MQRQFVSIREGQVHLRCAAPDATDQEPPLWMIHASPASSITLVPLASELARSRRVFAPDTLGNGDSAAPEPQVPEISYYADSTLRVMDALRIDQVDLYGTHTGAHIAAEVAILRPDRVRRLVIDGIGMFEPEVKRELLDDYAPAITPDSIGSYLNWVWHFVRDQSLFFPYFKRDAEHMLTHGLPSSRELHHTLVEVLKAIDTYHLAYRAAFRHADRERLPLIDRPTLVMAHDGDPLLTAFELAASAIPGATRRLIAARGQAAAVTEKAMEIRRFLDETTTPRGVSTCNA